MSTIIVNKDGSIDVVTVGIQGAAGAGIATGGTTGQFLKKKTNTDFDTEWATATGTGDMLGANNLSDVVSASTARSNLGLGNVNNTSDANKPISNATQTALDLKVDKNSPITGATKTKITYDAKGLITTGADATTADIADSSNKRYVTDAQLSALGSISGVNTGDQTSIVGISGNKTQFNSALSDGDFLFSGDVTQYTDEMAQDAVGTILTDSSEIDFTYNDGANTITASIVPGSIDESKLDASVNASLSLANTSAQESFKTITVAGQSNVIADNSNDTLTFVAGSNVTITTDATNDTITISSAGGGGGGLADGDYGDITVTGTGTVMTIDNNVVTYAKMQDISATNKVLGRSSAGSGDIQEIDCTAAGRALLDDASATEQRSTLGISQKSITFGSVSPSNDTIYITTYAPFSGIINSIQNILTSSGTITVAVQINGTNVTGLSSIAVTSSSQDVNATAANTFNIGDEIKVILSSNSSAANLRGTIVITQ